MEWRFDAKKKEVGGVGREGEWGVPGRDWHHNQVISVRSKKGRQAVGLTSNQRVMTSRKCVIFLNSQRKTNIMSAFYGGGVLHSPTI